MFGKFKFLIIIIVTILIGTLMSCYHTVVYNSDRSILYNLYNGMIVYGSDISIDEMIVLKQFTGSIFTNNENAEIFFPGSINRDVNNSVLYSYHNRDNQITVYMRAIGKKIWNLQFTDLGDGCRRYDGPCTIISTPMIPVLLQDIVVEQSGQQTILQGTGGYWVTVLRGH